MENNRIETLRLTGEDAKSFVHSFFCLSADEIREYETIQNKRNEHISIQNTKNGFIARINNLDLSFLDDMKEEHVNISIIVTVKIKNEIYCYINGTDKLEMYSKLVISEKNEDFTDFVVNEVNKIAA